jgi:hypothetical protein
MSQAVGTLPDFPGGKYPVYGPWLSGTHNEAYNAWFTFARTTDMSQPGPANTFGNLRKLLFGVGLMVMVQFLVLLVSW